MKIAVNGQYIDTKNIYKISEIKEYEDYLYFEIESFNKELVEVKIKTRNMQNIELPKENFNEKSEKSIYIFAEINKMRLESMRQEIVKIWAENQPNIPMINLESYITQYTVIVDPEIVATPM